MTERCTSHDDCARRIDAIETDVEFLKSEVRDLQIGATAKDEQIKTVFNVLAEIKQMLREYTIEMKGALSRLSDDIETVKARPGRFADGALSAGIAAIIGAAVMYFIRG